MKQPDYILGIDEAGRGPLAGPVYVGAVLAPAGFDFSVFSRLNDSKQMSESQRELVCKELQAMEEGDGEEIISTTSFSRPSTIDEHGINPSIKTAIQRCIRRLDPDPKNVQVYLDGGLSAPDSFRQKAIIGGDAIEPIISLASVAAKVSRDNYMKRIDGKYPEYNFAQHKGYGTAKHRQAIKREGLSDIHRQTYCQKLI